YNTERRLSVTHRSASKAVPEKTSAKLITFRRFAILITSACKWIFSFSEWRRSAPPETSSDDEGRTRPRLKFTLLRIREPYCSARNASLEGPSISNGKPLL